MHNRNKEQVTSNRGLRKRMNKSKLKNGKTMTQKTKTKAQDVAQQSKVVDPYLRYQDYPPGNITTGFPSNSDSCPTNK